MTHPHYGRSHVYPIGQLIEKNKKTIVYRVVHWLGGILGSVGHKVKITPATGKERGDLEIKEYVVLQKPQESSTRVSYWTTDKHKVFGCTS
jgi:hypothetical protein